MVQARADEVVVRPGMRVVVPPGDAEAARIAAYFIQLVARTGGPRLKIAGSGGDQAPTIRFRRSPETPGLGAEGYALDIGADGVVVSAPRAAGLFYGAVTLWQLIGAPQPAGRAVTLKGLHIEDAPRFAWRGLLLDSARHYQSVAFIERLIDWMALHKLNVLQWHLTDDQAWRLEIKRYPRLADVGGWRAPDAVTRGDGVATTGRSKDYGGVYTQAEVRRLVAFAATRQVSIVPEIEMPGHALAAITAYRDVGLAGGLTSSARGDWGVFPSIYNADEHTFTFLENVLTEVMDLFPSRFIHTGGDEAVMDQWNASPDIQRRMKELGVADAPALQSYFTRRIGAFLNEHGRRLIGWDEILQGGPLPSEDAVTSWHGIDGAVAAARSGHDVVLATAPTLYFDNRQAASPGEPPGRGRLVTLADVYAYDPGGLSVSAPRPPASAPTPPTGLTTPPPGPRLSPTPDDMRHVLGLQANVWTEHIRTESRIVAMVFPRAAAVAESGWTAEANRSWPSFVQRLPALFALYRALGLHADEGAIAVTANTTADPTGAGVTVSLGNQVGLGEIRYTVDGAAPSAASPAYRAPLDLQLPTRLRAATFVDASEVSPELDQNLDQASIHRRVSQDLRLCTEKVALNLEGFGHARRARPVFLADILNPCWIDAGVDLTGVGALSMGVEALPFNFQLGSDLKKIPLRPPATPEGELEVRLDACDGERLAVLPLARARANADISILNVVIPPHQGRHDLCLMFTARRPDPMWALAWVQDVPAGAASVAVR